VKRKDPLVGFLRGAYGIRDRYGRLPRASRFAVRVPEGGVVKVTLSGGAPTFTPAMPPSVAERMGLTDASQDRLGALASKLLQLNREAPVDSLILARAAQQHARAPTPPTAWSRFMAKIGLACGREAYGDEWLDGMHAAILSDDLLGDGQPRFAQRDHHPPVEVAWPYEPPKHAIWIEPWEDTAVLMIVLFGQLHGAVPVNASEAQRDPSAWSLDPLRRSFFRSTHHALHLAHAARVVERAGGTPIPIAHPEHPFVFPLTVPMGRSSCPSPSRGRTLPLTHSNCSRMRQTSPWTEPVERARPVDGLRAGRRAQPLAEPPHRHHRDRTDRDRHRDHSTEEGRRSDWRSTRAA
jgi:hypothetical protein